MINPVLASSARRRMRSLKTPIILTLYCVALAAFAYFYSFREFASPTITIGQMSRGMECYLFLIGLQFGLLLLVAPALTAGSIAGERERQTLDLLRVTNTGSFSIALGKLLESFGFLCLLIVASMPMLSLIFVTGGVSFGQMLLAILFLLLITLAALSVGLFASSLFKRTVTATVFSYLIIFGLGIVTLAPLWWDVRKFGEAYDAANSAGITLKTIDYFPISFTISPALGLLSLMAVQMQAGAINSLFAGYSHTLYVTFDMLPLGRYLTYHMIFLATVSIVLTLLSALRIRPNRRGKTARKRK